MRKIAIIGVGNIGSRHLQALKAVKNPLNINVIDPNPDSLDIAKNRYNTFQNIGNEHQISYSNNISDISKEIEIAIIATSSLVRRDVIEKLLHHTKVKFMILEKVLFQKEEDYYFIQDLLSSSNCLCWINCTRRIIPVYQYTIKNWFEKKKIYYSLSGSNFDLITNIIHHIDYMAYILESTEFNVDTSYLNPALIPSKRANFLELEGILQIHFENGSHGIFSCNSSGDLPEILIIDSDTNRCVINQKNPFSFKWDNETETKWKSIDAKLHYTSELTTQIVENLLNNEQCNLTSYEESMEIHLNLLKPLLIFINKFSEKKFDYYPFT
ncbi:MAG: Gfo/Idh/MocA family oxidoreductase [Promethearchaeota archaeon]